MECSVYDFHWLCALCILFICFIVSWAFQSVWCFLACTHIPLLWVCLGIPFWRIDWMLKCCFTRLSLQCLKCNTTPQLFSHNILVLYKLIPQTQTTGDAADNLIPLSCTPKGACTHWVCRIRLAAVLTLFTTIGQNAWHTPCIIYYGQLLYTV